MTRRSKKLSAEVIKVDTQQLDELAERAATNTLSQQDAELMRQIFQSYS